MIDRETALKRVNKIDDKLIAAKILDKAVRAERQKIVTYSDFLDPYQKSIIDKVLYGLKDIEYRFFGGYEGAERAVVVFRPDFMSEDELSYPLKAVNISCSTRENLTHRDYLGALMGLGIKREKIGDILVGEESCSIVVMEEIADYIDLNLSQVGNASVDLEICETDDIVVPDAKTKEVTTTVASLRLDSISGAGFAISRSKMTEVIKSEKVSLNWEIVSNPSKQIKEGDTISVKGKGRVIVDNIGKTTKKGRISVTLKRLI